MALTICVTGNIASGKSTCASLLAECFPKSCYVAEPHLENPFLPLYLKDKLRWGFTAQLRYFRDYALFFQQTVSKSAYDYHFVDAGIWTNQMVYIPYLRQEQIITDDEYAFYREMCATIQHAYAVPDADAFIFVEASPQTCWDRMHERGWQYQVSGVDPAYIQALDTMLRAMWQTVTASGVPALTLSSEAIDFLSAAGQDEVSARVQRLLNPG